MRKPRKEREPWTPWEDELVKNLISKYEAVQVAKLMGRSVRAITDRVTYLGFSSRIRDGWYTCSEVAEMLGVSRGWVVSRIESGAIKAAHHYKKRPPDAHGAWHIKETDLRDFIRMCPEELSGKNLNMSLLVDILAGIKVKTE